MAETRGGPSVVEVPEGRWVELRIHGVSGTPPESMLESAHVKQIAGDSWGRIFRPVDGVEREVQTEEGRTLEGYHWGKYTSGSWLKGLWLILIPFGLVNAAAFMVPLPGADSPWLRRLYAAVQGLLRGIGVGVTCTFALASGLILVDLVAWQWATGLPWLEARPSGPVMTAGVLLAGVVVYLLYRMGDENRVSSFGAAPAGSLAAAGDDSSGLLRQEFYCVGSPPVLGRLHLSAGWCVVSLIGALTWQRIAGHSTSDFETTWQHVVWASSLVVLGAVTLVVTMMGDPDEAIEAPPPAFLAGALNAIAWGALFLSGATLLASAAVLGRTKQSPVTLDFDQYSQWLATIAGIAMVVLAALLGVLALLTQQPESVAGPFRRYAGGMAAWGAASTGVFLGVGFCGAFVLGLAKTLGARAQTELIYRIAYSWGITVVLMLLVAGIALIGWGRTRSRMALRAAHEYQGLGAPLGPPSEGWPKRIAGAMSAARLKLHVAPMILTYAAAGLAMTAVTSIEMLGESNTPWARDWYHNLGWVGYLSQRSVPPPATTDWWVTLLTNVGTYTLIALAGLLFVLGRRSLRAEQSRRGANVIWDVISFWPHAAHPFVPPAYSQFAVHDLRRRIRFHLGLPPIPPESDTPVEEPVRADAPAIVVSAHSQGSLIAFAAMLWLGTAERRHVGLVTYGSQLQVAYPRGFSAFVSQDLVSQVQSALDDRWVNLYRETDPIAGPVLSWHRSPMEATPAVPHPPTSLRVGHTGSLPDFVNPTTGRRESGHDWRVLDPPPIDQAVQVTVLTHLSRHSGYPASADYPAAVAHVRPL
jgi:hypothetical protein